MFDLSKELFDVRDEYYLEARDPKGNLYVVTLNFEQYCDFLRQVDKAHIDALKNTPGVTVTEVECTFEAANIS